MSRETFFNVSEKKYKQECESVVRYRELLDCIDCCHLSREENAIFCRSIGHSACLLFIENDIGIDGETIADRYALEMLGISSFGESAPVQPDDGLIYRGKLVA